jgi:hypothetical protein
MAGLDPAIHGCQRRDDLCVAWMAGSSPAMTEKAEGAIE